MQDPSTFTTLLFSDIEGSTRLWEDDRERMTAALAQHDSIVRSAIENHRGEIVKKTGDGVFAEFAQPADALHAALAMQRDLADPASTQGVALRVRCGLHTGTVERREGDLFGPVVNRASRLMSAAHGGQVLLSRALVNCVQEQLPPEASLRDLGRVRLKDLATAEEVYQLVHPALRSEFPALRSLEARPNNLPQQLTSFIGRETELGEVRELLHKSRLVTLLGVGGLGKTRLALQVAAELVDEYAEGVWIVELAALSDARRVGQAVASVLGVKEEAGQGVNDALASFVRSRELLLVLDNCEHLADACAALAKELLQAGAKVKILGTSREPLHIAGEVSYPLPALAVPNEHETTALRKFEAVRLFVDRAAAAQPTFELTPQNAAVIGNICRRLDGIPLALELAAARVRALAVNQIDARLDDCFRLLRGGDRTALPRQQTLRACIDWSYDLLSPEEKLLLQRLSVFAGGWTLAAAESVAAGDDLHRDDVLDLLTLLHDKSLVTVEQSDEHVRYRLLETVRHYAREHLEAHGSAELLRDRHRDYFLELAERAQSKLTGSEQMHWLQRLEAEHENLRASLERCIARLERELALKLCGALHRFWWPRGYLTEGREWCIRALAIPGADAPTPARAKVLNVAGVLAYHQGDYAAARALNEESLAIRRLSNDQIGIAASLNNLGLVACDQGDYATAHSLYTESLAIKRKLGDQPGIANSLNNLGNVAYDNGDLESARNLYEESLAIARELGDREGVSRLLANLGNTLMHQGDFASARKLHEEGLAIKRELGHKQRIASSLKSLGNLHLDQGDLAAARNHFRESLIIGRDLGDRFGIAAALEGLAALTGASGNSLEAARLWGAVERLRETIGTPLTPKDQLDFRRKVKEARSALADDARFDRAWQEGRAIPVEKVICMALGDALVKVEEAVETRGSVRAG